MPGVSGAGVGTTAVIAAACRSVESHRDDRLISDSYAEALVLATHPTHPIPTRPGADAANWRAMSDLLGTRSRFFDDALSRATDGGIRQVVILASGLDTRSHRLDWPAGTVVFEIDQPAELDFKRRVLDELGATATCDHRPVPHDLREDWAAALVDAGFADVEPTVWVAEGLLYYLSPGVQQSLLETVDACSAPGSRWAVEDDSAFLERMADPAAAASIRAMGVDLSTLLEAGPRPEPELWLRDRGWVVETRLLRTAAAEYRRALDPLVDRTNGEFLFTDARKARPAPR